MATNFSRELSDAAVLDTLRRLFVLRRHQEVVDAATAYLNELACPGFYLQRLGHMPRRSPPALLPLPSDARILAKSYPVVFILVQAMVEMGIPAAAFEQIQCCYVDCQCISFDVLWILVQAMGRASQMHAMKGLVLDWLGAQPESGGDSAENEVALVLLVAQQLSTVCTIDAHAFVEGYMRSCRGESFVGRRQMLDEGLKSLKLMPDVKSGAAVLCKQRSRLRDFPPKSMASAWSPVADTASRAKQPLWKTLHICLRWLHDALAAVRTVRVGRLQVARTVTSKALAAIATTAALVYMLRLVQQRQRRQMPSGFAAFAKFLSLGLPKELSEAIRLLLQSGSRLAS
uniref:Uncharacterized protein n=1 Tax=Chrysotila carterae TaxID=13221 RepID=A0A7S4C1A5_CHRCT|mmetsp:Transcript_57935/g.125831  ORF Transcript_57935/g.125831 Transcript_57935/m.125831 type:complete len:344 (-) Transcript_57935:321-1352(-)